MTVEIARAQPIDRPWGVLEGIGEAGAWLKSGASSLPIGEIWYERSSELADRPALLLKLLLTSRPLSIQVHPDDAYARSKGLENGKTEAWYVIQAAAGAAVALGLKSEMTRTRLRQAALDGSIAELMVWKDVAEGEAILVPAGTIHAIGPGLVIAEIQQRSEATYRLFDYGSDRELHLDDGLAVSQTGPAALGAGPLPIDRVRTLLVRSPYFVMERLELEPGARRSLVAELETWVLVVGGSATAGSHDLAKGDALFVQSDRVDIRAGPEGLVALAAYTGGRCAAHLLQSSALEAAATDEPLHPFVKSAFSGPSPIVRGTGALS
jgi:mannose-6-phosphate isomerase